MPRRARRVRDGERPVRRRKRREEKQVRALQPVDPDAYEGQEMHFLDHLEELRVRLLRSLIYVTVSSLICVGLGQRSIIDFVMEPAVKALGADAAGTSGFIFTEPMAPMMTWLKIGLLAGLAISIPFVMLEAWGFIAPALTRREKRVGYTAVLACPGLFLAGAAFIYLVIPTALKFLMQFKDLFPNTRFLLDPAKYLNMMLTLMTGMGLVFQMPIVIAVLTRVGIITSATLLRFWRHSIVIWLVIAAVITPTWDPVNLSITATPMILLYFASILIAKVIERGNRRREAAERDVYEVFDESLPEGRPDPEPPATPALPMADPEGHVTTPTAESVIESATPYIDHALGADGVLEPRGDAELEPGRGEERVDDTATEDPSADDEPERPTEPED
jgi:sec-independent protein translocase protein TatC